ncbi:MAG TPA: hypothetical protein DCE14_04445 [Kosmotogaceae bacterium]|nr:hypothetical protein [Kosmotogaceae bacterium]
MEQEKKANNSQRPNIKGLVILFGIILPAILIFLYFFTTLLFWMLAIASFIAFLGVLSALLKRDPMIFGESDVQEKDLSKPTDRRGQQVDEDR